MEGRSKSRFPEKCKNCIWGRFPSQFWCHFEAMLAPKMHVFWKKKLLEINPKKEYPPRLKRARGRSNGKPDGSRKAPPSRQRVVWIIDKKQQQLNKNTNNCTIVASIDDLCSDSWLDFDFNVDYLHEVVEEVATSSWKKTQCLWSDTPWAKARRTLYSHSVTGVFPCTQLWTLALQELPCHFNVPNQRRG